MSSEFVYTTPLDQSRTPEPSFDEKYRLGYVLGDEIDTKDLANSVYNPEDFVLVPQSPDGSWPEQPPNDRPDKAYSVADLEEILYGPYEQPPRIVHVAKVAGGILVEGLVPFGIAGVGIFKAVRRGLAVAATHNAISWSGLDSTGIIYSGAMQHLPEPKVRAAINPPVRVISRHTEEYKAGQTQAELSSPEGARAAAAADAFFNQRFNEMNGTGTVWYHPVQEALPNGPQSELRTDEGVIITTPVQEAVGLLETVYFSDREHDNAEDRIVFSTIDPAVMEAAYALVVPEQSNLDPVLLPDRYLDMVRYGLIDPAKLPELLCAVEFVLTRMLRDQRLGSASPVSLQVNTIAKTIKTLGIRELVDGDSPFKQSPSRVSEYTPLSQAVLVWGNEGQEEVDHYGYVNSESGEAPQQALPQAEKQKPVAIPRPPSRWRPWKRNTITQAPKRGPVRDTLRRLARNFRQ